MNNEKIKELITKLKIYKRTVGWEDIKDKVIAEIKYIDEEKIILKIYPKIGFDGVRDLCPNYSEVYSNTVEEKESKYKFYIKDLFFIPIFEILDLRKNNPDITWHAPVFKTLKYSIENVLIDFEDDKVTSFEVVYDYLIEDVSKAYEYWD